MTMHAAVAPARRQGAHLVVALASGTSGGVLAPLLIMGGALGALLAPCHAVWRCGLLGADRHGGDDGRHDALAADQHVFAVELTRQFHMLLLPLAGRVGGRFGVTVLLMRRSILTEKIARARPSHHARIHRSIRSCRRASNRSWRSRSIRWARIPVDKAVAFFMAAEGPGGIRAIP